MTTLVSVAAVVLPRTGAVAAGVRPGEGMPSVEGGGVGPGEDGGMPSGSELAGDGAEGGSRPAPTIRQVIDNLQADIPGAPFPQTVDTIKAGDPEQPVKGIVTTMFATDAVIEKTISLGANFIIAHEPTFYNHLDETSWLGDDPVLKYKKELLDKHGIVVWRFHDGLHRHQPDGVRMGVLNALGWDKYYSAETPSLTILPSAMSLGEVIQVVKKGLQIEQVKVIGSQGETCQRIVLAPGAAGGRSQIAMIQNFKPDLLICGEINEWETSEYVRDARYQGQKIALIVLGHCVSEEPGLQWLLPILNQKFPGIKATHVPSNDAFRFA